MSGDHLNKLQTGTSSLSSAVANNNITTMQLNAMNHRYIKLKMGDRLFLTSIDTLTKQDNMLRAMFSGRMDVSADSDGYVLIDRCGKHFELILNYLRDEDLNDLNLNLDARTELELHEILKEAKFYCIQPLINLIEQKLINKSASQVEQYLGASIVSMITSKNDLIKILKSTDKPCIRLLINRHNNKYSYTNNSDDNLLKNIELFERMAIKFKNRIMFIKDTTSNEEICCWYFHSNGKKLAEVCCTSIVYTTEKKQTKVEFPDSKILEEIINAVLFESTEAKSDTAQFYHNLIQNENDDLVETTNCSSSGLTSNQQGNNLVTSPNNSQSQSNNTNVAMSVSISSLSLSNPTNNQPTTSANITLQTPNNFNSRRSNR